MVLYGFSTIMAGLKFYWLIVGIFVVWRASHFFQAEDGRKGGFLYATCNSAGRTTERNYCLAPGFCVFMASSSASIIFSKTAAG